MYVHVYMDIGHISVYSSCLSCSLCFSPDAFPPGQRYIVFETEHGGVDLEHYKVRMYVCVHVMVQAKTVL